jgi:hypothetical protein
MGTYLSPTQLNETLIPFDVLVVSQVVVLMPSKSEPAPRSAVILGAGRTEQGTETSFVEAQRYGLLRDATVLAVLLHDVADAVIIEQQTATWYRAVSGAHERDVLFIVVADQRLRGDDGRQDEINGKVREHVDGLCGLWLVTYIKVFCCTLVCLADAGYLLHYENDTVS